MMDTIGIQNNKVNNYVVNLIILYSFPGPDKPTILLLLL